jgi:hypothetical protein
VIGFFRHRPPQLYGINNAVAWVIGVATVAWVVEVVRASSVQLGWLMPKKTYPRQGIIAEE